MNCDPLARWYRWLEFFAFGRALERCREQFLPALTDARHALVLGDGDGRFTSKLLRANRFVQVESVDSSRLMLQQARRRVPADALPRVDFHLLDARDWQPDGPKYDLIVTHFFLDCFPTEELAPMVERIASAAVPEARWIVSEFHQPESGLAAWRARLWIRGLYWLFGLTTGLQVRRLPDHASVLERYGFRLRQRCLSQWGLLASERWKHEPFFKFDARTSAHLHSRTPKS